MNHTAFFASLKQGEYANIYLFTGEEQHVKRSALEALRKNLLPEGMETLNESMLDGAVSASRVIEEAETLPMMCDRRLVVVTDWAILRPGRVKNEEADAEQLAAWLPTAPDSCTLVLYMTDSADGRKKLTKEVEKYAQKVEFSLLEGDELHRWISRRLKEQGKRISREAFDLLVTHTGRALTALGNELDKLSAYCGEREEITREDVERVVSAVSIDITVFQMIDCLLSGRRPRAHALLRSLLDAGQSRLGIIGLLNRQMRLMTHVRTMSMAGIPAQQIAKTLGLSSFQMKRTAEQAARFKPDALEKGYRACVEAEYAIKSGRAREDAALDLLIFSLGNDSSASRRGI